MDRILKKDCDYILKNINSIFLIYTNISFITLIPLYMVILLNLFSFYLARRENMDEYNKSLNNINNIDLLN